MSENGLRERITNYLSHGGLFNPEHMEHEKVRALLIECRDALAGTYLSGVSGTSSGPQQSSAIASEGLDQPEVLCELPDRWKADAERLQDISETQANTGEHHRSDICIARAGELSSCAIQLEAALKAANGDSATPSPTRSGLPQNTSGDGSESAGLREPRYQCFFCKEWFTEAEAKEHFTDEAAKRDWEHWWECYYPAMGLNGSSQFKTIEAATRDSWIAAKAALAPAILRPPTQGFDYKREARKWLNTFMGLDAFGGFCESELIALLKRAAQTPSLPPSRADAQTPSLPPSRADLSGDRTDESKGGQR